MATALVGSTGCASFERPVEPSCEASGGCCDDVDDDRNVRWEAGRPGTEAVGLLVGTVIVWYSYQFTVCLLGGAGPNPPRVDVCTEYALFVP